LIVLAHDVDGFMVIYSSMCKKRARKSKSRNIIKMREPSHIKLRVVGITQAEGQIPKIAFKKYKCVMIFMA